MTRILFLVSIPLFLATTACSRDGVVEGNPDDTITNSNDPTDTVPDGGGETDTPSTGGMVTFEVMVHTTIDELTEPCMTRVLNSSSEVLAEGMSFQLMQVRAKPGDTIFVIGGTDAVQPDQYALDFVTNLDPPTGAFYLHTLDDGTDAISLAQELTVTDDGKIPEVTIPFHRYANGRWTVALIGQYQYWGTSDVKTPFVDNPETSEVDGVLATEWDGLWGKIAGSSYLPIAVGDGSTISGSWRPDGMIDVTISMAGETFDMIAFPGEPGDDPR